MKSKDIPKDIIVAMSSPQNAFASNYDYKVGKVGGNPYRNCEKEKFVRLFFMPKEVCKKAASITLFYDSILSKEHVPAGNKKIEHETDWGALALHSWYASVLPATKDSFVLLGTKFLNPNPFLGIGKNLTKQYLAEEEVEDEKELFEYYFEKHKIDFEDYSTIVPFHIIMDDNSHIWLEKTIERFVKNYKENCYRNLMMSIIVCFFYDVLSTCGPDNQWFFQYFTNNKSKTTTYIDKNPPSLWVDAREKLITENKFNYKKSSSPSHHSHSGYSQNHSFANLPKKKKKLRIHESKIDKFWGSTVLPFFSIDGWVKEQYRLAREEFENRYNYYD